MTTPIQLVFIALGVIIAIQSLSKGIAVGALPTGWFFAEDAENSVYVWLGAVFVWSLSLVFLLKVQDARNNQKQPQR
jgi:hypothetical protein